MIDIFTNTPPLNHVITFERKVNLFIGPINCLFSLCYFPPYFLLLLTIVNFQSFIIGKIQLLHSGFNLRSIVPTFHRNFIASEMNIIVRKSWVNVFHDFFNNIISFIQSWIELSIVFCVAVNDDIFKIFASSPSLSMGRSINFWDESDSTSFSILN